MSKTLRDIIDKYNIDTSHLKIVFNKSDGHGWNPMKPTIDYLTKKISANDFTRVYLWRGGQNNSLFRPNDIVIQLVQIPGNQYKCMTVNKVLSVTKNNNYKKGETKWIFTAEPENDILSDILINKIFKDNRPTKEKSTYSYQFDFNNRFVGPDKLEVVDNLIPFPGKDVLNCTFKELKAYIDTPEWYSNLKDVYAVYLIRDNNNGKQYVGSATSKDGGLYSRWKSYIETGNGGNKDLSKLSKEYIENNFSYTILEEFGKSTKKEDVLAMESKWKNKLGTRQFGYNNN